MTIPNKWLTDTVDINHVTLNSSGRSITTDENVICRISEFNQLVRNETGDHIVSITKIYFDPSVTIENTSEIVFDSIIHKIKTLKSSKDGSGNIHHYEVILA